MTHVRALLALAAILLAPVTAVALLLVFGWLAVSFRVSSHTLAWALPLLVLALVPALLIGHSRRPGEKPDVRGGRLLARGEAPGLWSLVDRICQVTAAPVPDQLLVTRGQDVGLVEGKGVRSLRIGLPLLLLCDAGALSALVSQALADVTPGRPGPIRSVLAWRSWIAVRAANRDGIRGWLLGRWLDLADLALVRLRRDLDRRSIDLALGVAGDEAVVRAADTSAVIGEVWPPIARLAGLFAHAGARACLLHALLDGAAARGHELVGSSDLDDLVPGGAPALEGLVLGEGRPVLDWDALVDRGIRRKVRRRTHEVLDRMSRAGSIDILTARAGLEVIARGEAPTIIIPGRGRVGLTDAVIWMTVDALCTTRRYIWHVGPDHRLVLEGQEGVVEIDRLVGQATPAEVERIIARLDRVGAPARPAPHPRLSRRVPDEPDPDR